MDVEYWGGGGGGREEGRWGVIWFWCPVEGDVGSREGLADWAAGDDFAIGEEEACLIRAWDEAHADSEFCLGSVFEWCAGCGGECSTLVVMLQYHATESECKRGSRGTEAGDYLVGG